MVYPPARSSPKKGDEHLGSKNVKRNVSLSQPTLAIRAALIFISIALSQTPAYAARLRILG